MVSDYSTQWKMHKKLILIVSLLILFAFPATIPLTIYTSRIMNIDGGLLLTFFAALWCISFLYYALKLARFKCPRCNQKFFSHEGEQLCSVRCCANCGLKLYAVSKK